MDQSKFKSPELKSTTDKVPSSFKQEAGNTFVDIYKFRNSYLEWMINKTNICFNDLNEFLVIGNPISQEMNEKTVDIVRAYYQSHYTNKGTSKGFQASVDCIKYMLNEGLVSENDFVEIKNYKFSEEMVANNELKLSMLRK